LQNDFENLKKIISSYENIEEIEVNQEIFNLGLDKNNCILIGENKIEVSLIKIEDFNI